MKRLLKVTTFTALLTVLRMASGFLVSKAVAVYTGPGGMAMLGQIQNIVGALNGLVNAPAGSGIVRFTAENIHKGYNACSPWWKASVHFLLIISLVIIPTGIYFSCEISKWLLGSESYGWLINITVLMLPLTAIGTLINSVINGQQKYQRYVTLGIISVLFSSSVMIFLIAKNNVDGALLAASIQYGLIGLILFLSSIKQPWLKLCYWLGSIDKKYYRDIGGYVLMALTSAFTVPVAMLAVRSILVSEFDWSAAGYWQAVFKLSDAYLSVITIALGTYYLPRLSACENLQQIKREISKTVFFILPFVAVMGLTIYLLRNYILKLLFSDEFLVAGNLLPYQLVGDFFKVAGWLVAYPMIARGATFWFVGTQIFFALLYVFLVSICVKFINLTGVTLGYLINQIIYLGFVLFFFEKFSVSRNKSGVI